MSSEPAAEALPLDEPTVAAMLVAVRPELASDLCAALDRLLDDRPESLDADRRDRLLRFHAELRALAAAPAAPGDFM